MKWFFLCLRNQPVRRAMLILTVLYALAALTGAGFSLVQARRDVAQLVVRDVALAGGAASGKAASELCILTEEIDPDDVAAGRQLLARVGYADAPLASYPYYRTLLWGRLLRLLVPVCGCFLLSAGVLLGACGAFYKRFAELTALADQIARGERPSVPACGEGDEARMRYAISAMAKRLQYSAASLKQDKEYLILFLSNISHQLKTPLSALRMYHEILLEKPQMDPQRRAEFLDRSRAQIDRLDWLIQGLLRSARLDAGVAVMRPRLACLLDTIQNAVSPFTEAARQRQVALTVAVPGSLKLLHDPDWVAEALANLVKNALEHTGAGDTVAITAQETPLTVQLLVEDNGEGMESTEIPHIFERFYRKSSKTHPDSVGIGLSLARNILEKNNADISVKSALGQGSRFTITFLKHPLS